MKTILKVMAAATVAVVLTACALLRPLGADDEARRGAKVTLAAYNTTQQALLIYGQLPLCDQATGVKWICRSGEIWAQIKIVERAASLAIAEATPVLNGSKADAGELLRAIMAIDRVKALIATANANLKAARTAQPVM